MLNPNLAAAWFLGGFLRIWRGEPDEAIEHLARAMRLSPLDPEMFRMQAGMALAHLFAGRFDAAVVLGREGLRELPSFLLVVCLLAASHALAGRTEEARRAMHHLRRLDPALRLANLRTGSRSGARKISRRSRTACEERGCRNDSRVPAAGWPRATPPQAGGQGLSPHPPFFRQSDARSCRRPSG